MKTIIAGSRGIIDRDIVDVAVASSGFKITEVVSGMCPRSPDEVALLFADDHGIPIKEFPAQWKDFGKKAGFYRNAEMAKYADALIAVWDGESNGTRHMISCMKSLEKPVFVYNLKENNVHNHSSELTR